MTQETARQTSAGYETAPWFQRALRWSLVDPRRASMRQTPEWWRAYWQRLNVQGVVIPATYGGDTASATALVTAARRDGHAVVMSHEIGLLDRATVTAHPDWAAHQNDQNPFGAADGLFACVNTSYYRDEVPSAARALAARDVDAVLGIGWSGLGSADICHCDACTSQFKALGGGALPAAANINDARYRDWITWSQARRVEIWKVNDDAVRQAHAGVRWIGMVPAGRDAQSHALLDAPALAEIAPMLFVDSRVPTGEARFRMLYQDGRYLHGLARNKTVVLVAGTTHLASRRFSAASTGMAEGRLRLASAVAAGMHPAVDIGPNPIADPRVLEIAPPVMKWHKASESSLRDRVGVGEIGVVWSPASAQLYGGAQSAALSDAPYRGMTHALMRAHLPYRSLTADGLTSGLNGISTLLLPNVTVLSDRVMDAIRQFVRDGGHLVATGHTSLYRPDGAIRANFGLSDVFGVDVEGTAPGRLVPVTRISSGSLFGAPQTTGGIPFRGFATDHSYLELKPQYEGQPASARTRHAIIRGWLDEADFLLFGGVLTPLRVHAGREVLMTYVKPFPQLPTDETYVRERTDFPGLVVGRFGQGRVAFMPADIDRRYGIDPTPDHGVLLASVVRWARGDVQEPVQVAGNGTIASALYHREAARVLHLLNLTGADNQTGVIRDHIPVHPVRVSIAAPEGFTGRAELTVSRQVVPVARSGGVSTTRFEFAISTLVDHEVVIIS